MGKPERKLDCEFLRILRLRLGVDIVALVGGGGKTSLMYALKNMVVSANPSARVVCTCTTKMLKPSSSEIDVIASASSVDEALDHCAKTFDSPHESSDKASSLLLYSSKDPTHDKRVVGVPPSWPFALLKAGACDIVFVEADGSRRLPFKAPDLQRGEPVYPVGCTVTLCVAGVDAVGVVLNEENVCRAHIVSNLTQTTLGATITASCVAQILGSPCYWHLPNNNPSLTNTTGENDPEIGATGVAAATMRFIPCINKVDNPACASIALQIVEEMQRVYSAKALSSNIQIEMILLLGELWGQRGTLISHHTAYAISSKQQQRNAKLSGSSETQVIQHTQSQRQPKKSKSCT